MACLIRPGCFLLCIIGASCFCLRPSGITRRFPHDNGTSLPITIAAGSQASHRLVSNILKILLRDVVGYEDVRLVSVPSFSNATSFLRDAVPECGDGNPSTASRCDDLTHRSTVPYFMINLETWVALDQGPTFLELLERNQFSDGGLLGPLGRYGMYVSETAYVGFWNEEKLLITDVVALRLPQVARRLSLAGLESEVTTYAMRSYAAAGMTAAANTSYTCSRREEGCINGLYVPKQCAVGECAILLVSDVDYSPRALKNLIDTMQLRVKIAWLGRGFKDFIMTVALPRNVSLLLFERYPTSLTVRPEAFRRMALPECTAQEAATMLIPAEATSAGSGSASADSSDTASADSSDTRNRACEFDLHEIRKVLWKQLALREPVVLGLVSGMLWSTKDYTRLLHAYGSCDYLQRNPSSASWLKAQECSLLTSELRGQQQSAIQLSRSEWDERFACHWLRENNRTWSKWMPPEALRKPKLYIGGMFPIGPGAWIQPNIIPAAVLAIELINKNESILPEYELELVVKDSGCRSDYSLKAFIDHVQNSSTIRQLIGILGPACADTAIIIASVAKHYNLPMISYSVETIVNAEDRNASYPYFFRTVPQINEYALVYSQFFRNFSWHHVATIVDDVTREFHFYHIILHNEFRANGITVAPQIKISTPKPHSSYASQDIAKNLEDIKNSKTRIIIADFYEHTARLVMCEAYKLKMTAADEYVWFLPGVFGFDWHDTDYFNANLNENVNCTSAEMLEAIRGYFSLSHAFFDEEDKEIIGNMTVGTWKKGYLSKIDEVMKTMRIQMPSYISDFGGYAYDAVWSFALALSRLNAENPSYLRDIHSYQSTTRFVQLLYDTKFDGASGPIEFTRNGDRHGIVHIKQYETYDKRKLSHAPTIVGVWKPELNEDGHTDILELYSERIVWPTGTKPQDTIQPTDYPGGNVNACSVDSFRRLLNVTCEAAIALAFVIGFSLLLVLVMLIVMIIKRRYDREMRKTQERLEQLGLYMDMNGPPRWLGLDEWELPREYVVLNRKLGEGAFGTVYGGEARGLEVRGLNIGINDWVAVAVKTLKVGSSAEEKLDFLSEAETMKKFDHKNIVKLLGVCTKGEPAYAIMEFMLHGDLKTFLLSRRHMVGEDTREAEDVTPRSLTRMAIDIISGLQYLHEQQYVHRDLASRNCLVSASKTVKIGDFGLARPLYNHDYYKFTRKGRLPVRWMAPESLSDGIFTYRSDCWSFGIVLYEIVTFGSFPYQGLSNSQVLEYVKNGSTLKVPLECTDEMKALLFRCWAFNSDNRPTSESIHKILLSNSELLQPLIAPPNSAAIPEYESAEMDLSPQPTVSRPLLSPGATMPVNSGVAVMPARRLPLQRPSSSLSSMELFRKSRNSGESTKFRMKRKSSNSLVEGIFGANGVPASPDFVPRSPSVGALRPSSPLSIQQSDVLPLPAFAFPAVVEECGKEDYASDLVLAYRNSGCKTAGACAATNSLDVHHSQPLLSHQ